MPSTSIESYRSAPVWSGFGSIVPIYKITTDIATTHPHSIQIQNNGSKLSLTGAIEGKTISVYNLSGQLLGSATAASGTTTINTSLSAGETCIVKIGDKSVKVLLR